MQTIALLFAALLALLLLSFALDRGDDIDDAVFLAINGRHLPQPLDVLVRLVSHFGLLATNVLIWGFVWYRLDREAGLVGGVGLIATWVTCRILKAATARTRPYLAVEGARLVGLAPSLSSFPSSHAANATYTAIMLTHLLGWNGTRATGAYLVAAAVCYARVYLGAHYPRDVLAGVVIGLGAALATVWSSRKLLA